MLGLVMLVEGGALAAGSERALVRDAGFRDGDVGYVLFDVERGRIEREHRSGAAFIPASTAKLATTLGALDVLGPAHRFQTQAYVSRIDGGGSVHLHLSGGGDPALVDDDLEQLAVDLVPRLAGRAVARFTFDQAHLPFIPVVDPSDDPAKSYNPPISALSVNFNRHWLRWSRSAPDWAARVVLRPALGHAAAGFAARRFADGRSIGIVEAAEATYLLQPRLPSRGQRRVAVRKPGRFAAFMLREYAARAGLALPEPEGIAGPPATAEVLAAVESKPLIAIAEGVLEYSNNLSAELLGLATAKRLWAEVNTLGESAAALRTWVAEKAPAATASGWRLQNQSGLSSRSRATPAALMALLQYGATQSYTTADGEQVPYFDLLVEPGWSLVAPAVSVHAKTGTMYYARSIAGRLVTKSGREMLFVFMHTDFDARSRYEGDPTRYGDAAQAKARWWLRRARRLERAVLQHWAATF